jgi:hypothetical protein
MMRASGVIGIVCAGLLLAGCAPVDSGVVTIDDVAAERAERSQARVDRLLESYGDYLTSRWPGLELPPTQIERWTELGEWPAVFGTCASELSGLNVLTDPAAGVFAVPAPQNDAELVAFETSIYACQGRFPPPSLARNEPGPLELAWIDDYVSVQLPACVRRLGLVVQPSSGAAGPTLTDGSLSELDPYSAVRSDTSELVRVQRVCPPASTVLGTLTAAGETR